MNGDREWSFTLPRAHTVAAAVQISVAIMSERRADFNFWPPAAFVQKLRVQNADCPVKTIASELGINSDPVAREAKTALQTCSRNERSVSLRA